MCPLRRFYEKYFSKVKIYDRTLCDSYQKIPMKVGVFLYLISNLYVIIYLYR